MVKYRKRGTDMLEKMADFFEKRLDEYDTHMLDCIESAREFYPFTAASLPVHSGTRILDLGCGTGLELEEYLRLNPSARITGIDLSRGMLDALSDKLGEGNIELICGSYFDVPFGECQFDAAVSVESLHHFTFDEKIPLYKKLRASLSDGGYFILTDYFASSDAEESALRKELIRLKKEEGITDKDFYHFDTPLTVAHEIEALIAAGFGSVTELSSWGATHTLKAEK